jgi:hypothetical protein
LVVFVDNIRGSGPTVELAWAVSRVVVSRIQYFGSQEASQKRRPPTHTPGAWAGGVFRTSSTEVSVTVSQEKRDKGKTLVKSLWQQFEDEGVSSEGCDISHLFVDYKQLEITLGFLVHLSVTFEMLSHHLKGFHLALASHLPKRHDEDWKIKIQNGWLT